MNPYESPNEVGDSRYGLTPGDILMFMLMPFIVVFYLTIRVSPLVAACYACISLYTEGAKLLAALPAGLASVVFISIVVELLDCIYNPTVPRETP